MGREVRRVPAGWRHPRDELTGHYKPLFNGDDYETLAREFLKKANAEGLQAAIDWFGHVPDINDYMPNWPDSERTHLMMYENTTEGTPISPAFETPEELARWLVDNKASAFGGNTGSYEGWLRVARGGYAPSAVSVGGGPLVSGVDGL